MAILTVAVVALAALVLVDLVLSAAIIRRLRETETRLNEMSAPPESGLAIGEPMPEFVSQHGDLSRSDIAGGSVLIGFFSAGCRHCPPQAEQLANRADELASRGVRVVSVLTVDEDATDELTPMLRKAGLLVTESGSDGMMATFQEMATPSFLMFGDDGRLVAKGHDIGGLMSAP